MESDVPPTDLNLPDASEPPASESVHDRHLREMEESFEALEEKAEHGLVRLVKIAVPAVMGLILAAVGSYMLGNFLRSRAERKRVARQMKVVRAERIVRAETILGRRAGFRARRRLRPALIDGPLSAHEAGEIIGEVLAEVDT